MTVNKGIYIGLCFLLGGLGIHKFYAGKWFQGLLYVAFSWTGIPVIIALIDLLFAIFKTPDVHGEIRVQQEEKLQLKKRNKVLLTSATLLTVGGVTGYAATNIFENLDAIKENYNITFNFAKSQKQKADELQQKLDNESGNKEQLQNEIDNLKSEIENIKQNHAQEITNKQAEITAKQEEINSKQQEVNQKQETINQLNNELGELKGQLSQVEAEVNNLLNYTNQRTNELVGGE